MIQRKVVFFRRRVEELEETENERVLRGLKNPDRVKLVALMDREQGTQFVTQFTDYIPGSTQPGISRALAELKTSGLVDSDKEGVFKFYYLQKSGWVKLRTILSPFASSSAEQESDIKTFADLLLPGNASYIELLATFFKAVGQCNRLKILQVLIQTPGLRAFRVADVIPGGLSQSPVNISVNLEKLVEAGIVEKREACYFIKQEAFGLPMRLIEDVINSLSEQE